MTGKERLTRAYLGQDTDRAPWTPMLYQWFNVHYYNGTLPQQLARCRNAIEASRAMGADIFAKHEAFVVHAAYTDCSFQMEFAGQRLRQPKVKTCLMDVFGPHGNVDFLGHAERHDTISTPCGPLTAVWVYDENAGAPFEAKNLWTDFETEYESVRALLNDIRFVPDEARWAGVKREIGEDGIAHLRIPPTPLKVLHWLAGPERATYFILDYPDKIAELVSIYEKKRIDLVKNVVCFPGTLVFTSGDNMDSLMYSPPIFEEFCGRSFRQVAEILHEDGKLLFTHACGQLGDVIKLCQANIRAD